MAMYLPSSLYTLVWPAAGNNPLVGESLPRLVSGNQSGSDFETHRNFGYQKSAVISDLIEMKDMGKGPMISNWKEQDAELDKLVAEMNSAPADKKLDVVAALVSRREESNGHVPNVLHHI